MSPLRFPGIFTETLRRFTPDPALPDALWGGLEVRYREPHRRYHTLDHLEAVIGELLGVRDVLQDWDALVLATAYHDAVYDAARGDNELQSADLADRQLSAFVPVFVLNGIREAILATAGHAPGATPDIDHFTDADLAILGASPATYRRYGTAIREEYGMYPDAQYRPGRAKVLRHFLDMPAIFKTPVFRQRYETAARANLVAELQDLAG